jgi:mono/diheme cytochrome c family protein
MKIFLFALAALAAASLTFCVIDATLAQDASKEAPKDTPKPTDANADLAALGAQLYAHNCSHCHGFSMVNSGAIAYDLRKFPHDDKARFVNSVTNGKNGRMPPWGDLLSKEDIDKLWAYVSSYKQQ